MNLPLNHKPIPGIAERRFRGFLFIKPKDLALLLQQPYLLINLIFILLIVLVFIYAAVFSPGDVFPVQSVAGSQLSSTGLSRAFSSLVRGNFSEALQFNQFVFQVVGFFILQLILRFIFSWLWIASQVNKNTLVIVDIILSVLLFLCGFGQMALDQLTR